MKESKSWTLDILIGNHTYLLNFSSELALTKIVNGIRYPKVPGVTEWVQIDNHYFRISEIQYMSYWEKE